ncbi:MAG: PQQ-dependent sugar dehydrogenase, partial [Pedosphaera parvula]|nr:PQQ-dependent sugar dehydrogenase [Pedosphaera parvula]
LAFDPQGRLTVGRENRGLLRLTLGKTSVEQVEVIDDTLLECRGLLYAFGSLYANANNSKGFYRLRDTNGDDRFDQVELLLKTEGGVGHGRNHIRLGPDNMIYLAHGNNVLLPPALRNQPPHRNYQEDQLIPNPWDARMFDGNMVAPAGHILRTDRDGKTWQMVAGGFRNELDVAFNPDGELFTYDADMEGDVAAPWYRTTRINHVVSAGEYGWRRGAGKFPAYYADSLPSNHDIGVGSPTGIEFGTHSHFPPAYREALFVSDWAYGRIIAVHLQPQGASYGAVSETFVSGRPLNVTDLAFGPDGAMYFITGGRRTQSGLYRVSYLGARNQKLRKSADALDRERQAAKSRELRHQLESFHRDPQPGESPAIVATVWPHLGNPDFWIRYAARIALEQQPARFWQDKALAEAPVDARLTALMALARTGESRLQTLLVARLNGLPLAALTEAQQLHALRDYALAFIRMGTP